MSCCHWRSLPLRPFPYVCANWLINMVLADGWVKAQGLFRTKEIFGRNLKDSRPFVSFWTLIVCHFKGFPGAPRFEDLWPQTSSRPQFLSSSLHPPSDAACLVLSNWKVLLRSGSRCWLSHWRPCNFSAFWSFSVARESSPLSDRGDGCNRKD